MGYVPRCGNLEKKVGNNVTIASNYYQDTNISKTTILIIIIFVNVENGTFLHLI